MEKKKQLNLNAPFYSVRRFSSPSHSCELTKPKSTNGNKPLLPPLRQQSLPPHKMPGRENDVVPPTKPASVPFQWEQTPGLPKLDGSSPSPRPPSNSSYVRFFSGEIARPPPCRVPSSGPSRFTSGELPRPPPGRMLSSGTSRFTSGDHHHSLYKPQVEGFSFIDHASLLEKLSESLKCNNKEDESNNGDDSDDSLSLSSGSKDSKAPEPSGTFSVDKRTRDLMMDRFLPAAKAAVLETNARRQQQQPKTVENKKTVAGEVKKQPIAVAKKQNSQRGTLASYYHHNSRNFVHNQESEEGDFDKESPRIPCKKSGRRYWGIIPRFCVNPLPAAHKSSKPRPQTPAFGEVRRLTRNALSGPLDKIIRLRPEPQKNKSYSGLLPRELPRTEGNRRSNSGQFPNPRRDSYSLSLSPLRRYRSGNSSPCRNEIPKSPSYGASGFSYISDKNNCNNNKFDDSKLTSSRKLFKALRDDSRNQKNDEDGPEVKRVIREEQRVESNESILESEFICKSPLPPPLPKSPSESWLWRTLPFSSPNRKSPARCKMDSDVESKWETIVKSSNLCHDRFLYSQELTPRLSHSRKLVKETL